MASVEYDRLTERIRESAHGRGGHVAAGLALAGGALITSLLIARNQEPASSWRATGRATADHAPHRSPPIARAGANFAATSRLASLGND